MSLPSRHKVSANISLPFVAPLMGTPEANFKRFLSGEFDLRATRRPRSMIADA
eukprot:COSAG02_NODE_30129_length_556_cov_1.776805_1_plen_52_part_10